MIRQYTASSRAIKTLPSEKETLTPRFESMYRLMYASVCGGLHGHPDLHVCYSVNRSTELVSIGGKSYLIYDRYLGQTLSFLTLLWLSDHTEEGDIIRYKSKCLAEMFFLNGKFEQSEAHAAVYMEMDGFMNLKRLAKDVDAHLRSICVLFQEEFIMLHELRHWMLESMDPDERQRLISDQRKTCLKRVERQSGKGTILDGLDASEELLREYRRLIDFYEDWCHDDRNIEETLCDAFALRKLSTVVGKDLHAYVASACLLCVNNLRVIGALQEMAGAGLGRLSILDAQARKMAFLYGTIPQLMSDIQHVGPLEYPPDAALLEDLIFGKAVYDRFVDLPTAPPEGSELYKRVAHRLMHGEPYALTMNIPAW